ncbi:hypothetical protein CRYUN_Cryun09bG0036000 [Craigia yunnanensis]
MFTPIFQKLRKGFWVSSSRGPALNQVELDEEMDVATVPDDVKEGCFTVFAVKGKETQRFVIELDNIKNPAFLSLLEKAREEYGFQKTGVLSLPCRPQELQEILEHGKVNEAGAAGWTEYDASPESY